LPVRRSVVVDGRMQPHEWIEGTWLLKTDGASHGHDHFFPGPTDIAWDLAGVIVEWELSAEATDYLLRRYRALTGDEARPRIAVYRLAYTLFRMGYCKMAAEAMRGSDEEGRLQRAYRAYRRGVEHLTRQTAVA
jgi:thiamine kinase-like enzyme